MFYIVFHDGNVKVRDALYEAWRGGNLKARVDDNGQPLTIPPIKRSDYEIELSPAELLDVNFIFRRTLNL